MLAARSFLTVLLASTLACAAPAPPPADAYTVRGEIVSLPDAPGGDILIRHQAIPEFRGMDGKVVGMDSMTMPFPLAPGVRVDGLAPGNPIEFVLELRWNEEKNPVAVTRITRLPDGTRLDFGSPPQSGATPR